MLPPLAPTAALCSVNEMRAKRSGQWEWKLFWFVLCILITIVSAGIWDNPLYGWLFLALATATLIALFALFVQVVSVYRILRMGRLGRTRRLLSFHSDHLRDYGWYVELDGRRIAKLTAPIWIETHQFWHAYRLCPLTRDATMVGRILDNGFWGEEFRHMIYRSRLTRVATGGALPGGSGPSVDVDGNAWIWMRYLALFEPFRTPWDLFQLWRKRDRIREVNRRIKGPERRWEEVEFS